jgi:murein DD-endopeptidase MepM/ murein hydrolase activator NlpD
LMRLALRILAAIAIAAALCVAYASQRMRARADAEFARQVSAAQAEAQQVAADVVLFTTSRVGVGARFNDSLQQLGLDPVTAAAITGSVGGVFDVRRFHAGNALSIGRSVTGSLRAVRYQIDADRQLSIQPRDAGFQAEIEQIPSKFETRTITGTVNDSLFGAVENAGETAELAMRISQIFGWDLDFYTDTRRGDTFKVVVEKKSYLDGKSAGYGRIFAAEYDNAGHAHQAVMFHDMLGAPAYYQPDGSALQKAFLRSPLKFGAPITSHFSASRFHPVLKEYRPHLGIDYGAPAGTPVQTIGSGRVVFAALSGGSGNLVKIQHSNGYETMYLHLSRILVHNGEHVEQGQVIGLVGMTGLATGPHLDFRITQSGQYRNFETLHLPPAEPVAKRDMDEFAASREKYLPLLGAPAPVTSVAAAAAH